MSPSAPRVSVSLVTWNGLAWLPGCLGSLAEQTLADHELLILDNGSTDGSADWLRHRALTEPRIHLRLMTRNLGYAAGHDRNIEAAMASAVLLLNQDVVLDPAFLASAVAALEVHPEAGSVQGRIRRLGPGPEHGIVLDSTGLTMQRDRRVVSRDQLRRDDGSDPRVKRAPGTVWGADGAAALYRREALESARLPRRGGGWEILDEDYGHTKEDVDLAWRLRRLGWTCRYEPAALAWHARSGGDTGTASVAEAMHANMANPLEQRILSWRNQRLMQLKNDDPAAVLRDLPAILRREVGQLLFMLVVDPRRLRAIPAWLAAAPWALRKRRTLQARLRDTPAERRLSGRRLSEREPS